MCVGVGVPLHSIGKKNLLILLILVMLMLPSIVGAAIVCGGREERSLLKK